MGPRVARTEWRFVDVVFQAFAFCAPRAIAKTRRFLSAPGAPSAVACCPQAAHHAREWSGFESRATHETFTPPRLVARE